MGGAETGEIFIPPRRLAQNQKGYFRAVLSCEDGFESKHNRICGQRSNSCTKDKMWTPGKARMSVNFNELPNFGFGHSFAIDGHRVAMSEAVHDASQEFWRPPALRSEPSVPALAAACDRCETEFIVGAHFCHVCGAARPAKAAKLPQHPWWFESLEFWKAAEFHRLKEWFGLSTAPLIAFSAGTGCVVAAIMVGLVYSVQNLADFQAIQLWRIEWLLAALVAFAAGILLKRPGSAEK